MKEIELRQKSVRNMWIIIWTIFITETYSTLYTVILAIWADKECYVQDVVWVKSLSTFVERSLQYVWWMYPIIWLLWPGGFKFTCCKKKKKRYSSEVDTNRLTTSALSQSINEGTSNPSIHNSDDLMGYVQDDLDGK